MTLFKRRRRSHNSMKKFYNWFHLFYGIIERWLSPKIDAVLGHLFPDTTHLKDLTAIEYACGSGLLGMKLSVIFKKVEGRDSSVNMIRRAKIAALENKLNLHCEEGNLLHIKESPQSYDYVFISFALHLFSTDDIQSILNSVLQIARKEVIIIDHSLRWNPLVAFVEWIEGSYYDKFIKLDFKSLFQKAGANYFNINTIADCSVMRLSR
jgi:ubiquinone/menaquinone biosynthesis C-methylase UbiE